MEKTGWPLNSLNSYSTFAVSHVKYVSKSEQEVYQQFFIFLVECGACELVNNESEKGCRMIHLLTVRKIYSPIVHL